MSPNNPRKYLETQILTASREQLLLMLYDGAVRFAEQGRDRILSRDVPGSHDCLVRAQRIVIELWCALNPGTDPELARNLGGLYSFVYLRLVHANVHREAKAVDEALGVLRTLREAWTEAAAKAKGEANPLVAPTLQLHG